MPTLTHDSSVQVRSVYSDGDLVISRDATLRTDLENGTASGQANGLWFGSLSLAAAAATTLDLRALTSTILGTTVTTGFSAVKQLTIRNASPGGTLTVDAGATNGWAQVTAYRVGGSGVSVSYAPAAGLPTTTTSKTLRITNNTTAVVTAGNTTNASTAVTGISSTASLAVGMAVSGTGIPAGTTVAGITSSTAVTLSAAATATGSAVSLTYQWVATVDVWIVGVFV
jgi:hypothetical protein